MNNVAYHMAWARPIPACGWAAAVLLLFGLAGCDQSSGSSAPGFDDYDHSSGDIDTFFIDPSWYTSNWRTGDFEGTGFRQWMEDGSNFEFHWDTVVGDQIGRIGRNAESFADGDTPLEDLTASMWMSATAELRNVSTVAEGDWYIWAIYGWTHRAYVPWPDTDDPDDAGWDNEFYIVFDTNLPYLDPPEAGFIAQGSATIDDIEYDFYRNDMDWGTPNQTQWMAVARSGWTSPGPVVVDVQKFLAHWVNEGAIPGEDYLVDLSFAVEGAAGTSGELVLADIIIP